MPKPTPEPLAIIGMGCRFPGGVNSPAEYWELLRKGVDAIIDIPEDRWSLQRFYHPNPDQPGKMYVRQGGFLQQPIGAFDAAYFGITPREAVPLDPQQRLLLEVSAEALMDAGIPSQAIRGSSTGVYIGAFTMDNMSQQLGVYNREHINSHTAVGATMVMLANRLSYTYDLRGPSFALDTACSSSLVAFHLACQALWNGECSMALAGGVNLMFRPEFVITMCKGRFLSPSARSRAFDASADGYVRGEGAGIIVLKPLAQALADGDPIQALVCATGTNQDGRSQGITVPNQAAQTQLMQEVMAAAGIQPDQIAYMEAHGTGTQVGDPIEAQSIGAALANGSGPKAQAHWIGSVKTNMGHLEAAAGIAGVMKVVLCLKHRMLPPHLHLQQPNPNIDFNALGLRIPTQVESLADQPAPLYMGVNSFGYGGSNAHAILQEYLASEGAASTAEGSATSAPPRDLPWLLPLSAASEGALTAMAQRYSKLLTDDAPLADMLYTLARRRDHLPQRLAVAGADAAALRAGLHDFLAGRPNEALRYGLAPNPAPQKLVFVYTGMGPQWWGMGQELLQKNAGFRRVIEECDAIFRQWSPLSLLDLFQQASGEAMGEPAQAQPANFALQVALSALWRELDIQPAALVGHSAGEIAAAYIAGSLSLEDALRVTYWRSSLMQRTLGQGKMLAVGLPWAEAEARIAPYTGKVSLAANNSASAVTLAGDPAALESLAADLQNEGFFARFLRVEIAYHSHQMDELEGEFRAALADLQPQTPTLPLYSTVTGQQVQAGEQNADYWWQNARQAVQLYPALQQMIADEYRAFLEVGPHPVLAAAIQESLREAEAKGYVLHSLKRKAPEMQSIFNGLGGLYTQGYALSWQALYPQGQVASLPPYPWQREILWEEDHFAQAERSAPLHHPLLQLAIPAPHPTWEADLNDYLHPTLYDHRVDDTLLFPAAGFVECGLALREGGAVTLENLRFRKALPLDPAPTLRVEESQPDHFEVYSRSERDQPWTLHASGRILQKAAPPRQAPLDLVKLRRQLRQRMANPVFYDHLYRLGYQYGEGFRGVEALWYGEGRALATIARREAASPAGRYHLEPALLDACLHPLLLTLSQERGTAPGLYIPVEIAQVRVHRGLPESGALWSYAQLREQRPHSITGDIVITDDEGTVCVELYGLRLQGIYNPAQQPDPENWLYELAWEAQPLSSEVNTQPRNWLLFSDGQGLGDGLAAQLSAAGQQLIRVRRGENFAPHADGYSLNPRHASNWRALLQAVLPRGVAGILYCWGTDLSSSIAAAPTVQAGLPTGETLLALLHALSDADPEGAIRQLYLFSHRLHSLESSSPTLAPGQAVLWGMGRVISNEHAYLRSTMLDIDATPESLAAAAQEVLASAGEPELLFREGQRYVHRLRRLELPAPEAKTATHDSAFALALAQPGILDSLHFREEARRPPAADEVEVRVLVSALNFKDLMKAMQLLPQDYLQETYFGAALGLECVGEIVRVGAGVKDYAAGDTVIVFSEQGSFHSYLTVPTRSIIARPQALPIEQAAIFINFVTAYYCLKEVARVQPGDRVLIHSATGGVGLAAIQVAQWLDAEVYATAGTEEKRQYLREELGIPQVSDSRSLQFVDDALAWSEGAGVDVVLNTLSGEGLHKSFELLAPYGRFVEIGKRDIMEQGRLAMSAFDRNLSFAAVDLDKMLFQRPQLFRRLFQELSQRFDMGIFQPLPVRVFPAAQVQDAFRLMAQARHIGKIMVRMAGEPVQVQALPQALIHPEASYLITGGWGGLGLEIAKWCVAQGARHLAIVSRQGAASPEARSALQEFQAQGVRVLNEAVDVSDGMQLALLMQRIEANLPPLRGVIHSAMVLDDQAILEMDAASFAAVMAPKALGAWHLHQATQGLPLDFFVLFSSISAYIGNPRQLNYVAANAFLDALAHFRQGQGLPATSINWGSIAEVGAVARNRRVEQYLTQLGIRGINPQDAGTMLGRVLAQAQPQVSIVDMDWAQWAGVRLGGNMAVAQAPLYSELLAAHQQHQGAAGSGLLLRLHNAPRSDHASLVAEFLLETVAQVTHISKGRIDPNLRLEQLGVDSLMGVELNNLIRLEAQVDFPVMTLTQGLNLTQLADRLYARIAAEYHLAEKA